MQNLKEYAMPFVQGFINLMSANRQKKAANAANRANKEILAKLELEKTQERLKDEGYILDKKAKATELNIEMSPLEKQRALIESQIMAALNEKLAPIYAEAQEAISNPEAFVGKMAALYQKSPDYLNNKEMLNNDVTQYKRRESIEGGAPLRDSAVKEAAVAAHKAGMLNFQQGYGNMKQRYADMLREQSRNDMINQLSPIDMAIQQIRQKYMPEMEYNNDMLNYSNSRQGDKWNMANFATNINKDIANNNFNKINYFQNAATQSLAGFDLANQRKRGEQKYERDAADILRMMGDNSSQFGGMGYNVMPSRAFLNPWLNPNGAINRANNKTYIPYDYNDRG